MVSTRTINSTFSLLLTVDSKLEEILRVITFNEPLNEEDKAYLLAVALLYLDEYKKDQRYTTYFEFSYYLLLKYSLITKDYAPLYDLSLNYGFFPIVEEIRRLNLLENKSIFDVVNESYIESIFTKVGSYTQTLQQHNVYNEVLKSDSPYISFSAPTSFGKSEVILSHIQRSLEKSIPQRIGIITPTRSLLVQTIGMLKNFCRRKSIKLVQHDEMLSELDNSFIAVLTQERALRVLEKRSQFFDVLYLDEAHNLFETNFRSILLSRVIRLNYQKNSSQQVIYLSPIVQDAENLMLEDITHEIKNLKISINLKDLDIYEYSFKDKKGYKYNRYLMNLPKDQQFRWEYSSESDYILYILENIKNKNFFYINSPAKIENFALKLARSLPDITPGLSIEDASTLDILIADLSTVTHAHFYPVELLKKGVIYLHAKMPDFIKEYLEYCYKEYSFLKFVVANTVILQGITLPIDSLFIMNTTNITRSSSLINLVGRVNRLNYIFNRDQNNLSKLICPIHFIDSAGEYSRENGKMWNQIKLLKSSLFVNELKNPLLKKTKESIKNQEESKNIINLEEFILRDKADEGILSFENVKRVLLKNNISNLVNITDFFVKTVIHNIRNIGYLSMDIVQTVCEVFFKGIDETILKQEKGILSRFIKLSSRNYSIDYYSKHIEYRHKYDFSYRVQYISNYLKNRRNIALNKRQMEDLYFIGSTYGTISRVEKSPQLYIDLVQLDDQEIVNYSIVKLKIEDDFVDFQFNNFVQILVDLEVISENEYNKFVFGTNDERIIKLVKSGLSKELQLRLEKKNLLSGININNLGMLEIESDFKSKIQSFSETLNGLDLYEFKKVFY